MVERMADSCLENQKQNESIRDFIVRTIVSIFGKTEGDSFFLDRPLIEMGLDSEALLELTEQISRKYQIPLKPIFFFKHNTAERIIAYLQEHVDPEEDNEVPETNETMAKGRSYQENGRKKKQICNSVMQFVHAPKRHCHYRNILPAARWCQEQRTAMGAVNRQKRRHQQDALPEMELAIRY